MIKEGTLCTDTEFYEGTPIAAIDGEDIAEWLSILDGKKVRITVEEIK